MKAYLITPLERRIEAIEYDGDWRKISPLIGADLFTTVMLNREEDMVYVDDEGLINGNPHGWFVLKGYGQPLKGKGLVLGTDVEGNSVAPTINLGALYNLIEMFDTVDESKIDRSITVRAL